jgi:hypothetical protein
MPLRYSLPLATPILFEKARSFSNISWWTVPQREALHQCVLHNHQGLCGTGICGRLFPKLFDEILLICSEPKFEMAKFGMPNTEMPEAFRDMAEKGVAHARDTNAKAKAACEQAGDLLESTYATYSGDLPLRNLRLRPSRD